VGFFAMSVLVLGVWPGRVLENETRTMSPAHPLTLTASQQRGRVIYSREGCAYCHTQQIRMLDADVRRFGQSTEAWETQFDYPHLWGTRRIGPDLSREGSIRTEDWQFAHLYAPRAVVPDSVMPAFPSLFDGGADRPAQSARDLLAYLESLGQPRELAEPDEPLNASAAKARRKGDFDALPSVTATRAGDELYRRNCAGCHGEHGQGDGPAAPGLSPRPANLAAHDYGRDRIGFVFSNGVWGTAMPAWRDWSVEQRAAVAAVVRGFHTGQISGEVTEAGAKVYAENCAQCHGENGLGDGPAASEISVVPTNFTMVRPSLEQSLHALRNGVPGTPMAPWNTRLTQPELAAVAQYVRTFFR
jgi:cbb3-type cytochrome c oxidase subunit II